MWHLWWQNCYCSEPEDFCLNVRIGICICSVLRSFKAWCCQWKNRRRTEHTFHVQTRETWRAAGGDWTCHFGTCQWDTWFEARVFLLQNMCHCSPRCCIQGNIDRRSDLIFDLNRTWRLWRSVSKILFSFRCWWPLTGSKDMSCVDHISLSVINTTFLVIIPTCWT